MTVKRRKGSVGDVVSIPLSAERVAFGLVLDEPLVAFFDLESMPGATPPVDTIVRSKVAFQLLVENRALTRAGWARIGHVDVPANLETPPLFYKQDAMSGALNIVSYKGFDLDVSPAEAPRLERCAVWSAEQVEERLRDHFAGRPNLFVESMRKRAGFA